jgi:hypothetical protein
MGNKIKRSSKNNSTTINTTNNTVLEKGFNQRKYSTKSVKIKYSKPMPTKKMVPRSNSLV